METELLDRRRWLALQARGAIDRLQPVRSCARALVERVALNRVRGEAAKAKLEELGPMRAHEPGEQAELQVQQGLGPQQFERALEHQVARVECCRPDEEMADRRGGRMKDLHRASVELHRRAAARGSR